MVSICNLFFESARVFSEHPSGIVAPFGMFMFNKKSKDILAKAQSLNEKDPSQQVKFLNRLCRS